jgi:hypothetical protein
MVGQVDGLSIDNAFDMLLEKSGYLSKERVVDSIRKIENFARSREDMPGCIRFAYDLKKELGLG